MNAIADLLASQNPQDAGRYPGCFVLGTVAKNDDSNYPGMVKVEFTAWQDGQNISKWMPVLSSYAGKEYGRYLIPEVDDVVLVGFIGDYMEKPFVLGSFYPAGAAQPSDQFTKENFNRQFKTKGEVKFTVKDDKGKQEYEALTPKGLKIRAEDDGETITLSDKGGKNYVKLDCKNGEISVTADKKITLKTGSCTITMDGQSGALELKCMQFKMEASQTANIKSNAMMTIDGGVTTVQGKQASLKGAAMAEVTGGMVKIG